MLCFPNCKINLGLYITSKRADGYHNLETVFYPVLPAPGAGSTAPMPLRDVLEIVPGQETCLHTSGLPVAGDSPDNLVMKAYRLLKQQFPEKVSGLDIYLHKAIPMGAGLGGGSADGACMLRLLNDYFHLDLGNEEVAAMALQLGSDCPFFIYNTPQFAGGRGEHFTPSPVDLSAYSLQVICPQVHVSTAKAFNMIIPRPATYDLRQLATLPVAQWKDRVSNDFEAVVFAQHSELAAIKAQLYAQGALYASMSGSGSAVYGIFEKGSRAGIQAGVAFGDFYVV